MRLRSVLGLVIGLCGLASAAAAAPPPAEPKLVVVISVDQLSLDLYRAYAPTFTGGLKRLSSGLVFTGYQSHGATETCPGHSTLLTGDHPAKTGVVANNWYDRKTGSNLYCVSQAGTSDETAKTSALLKVDTLGDWMRHAQSDARVFSVSGKDRAAIMMAGHGPNGVYWWDDGVGFTTSSYAGPADAATLAPAERFNKSVMTTWAKTPPALWSAETASTCKAHTKPFTIGRLTWTDQIPPDTNKDVTTGEVIALERRGGDWRIILSRGGSIDAEVVVIAAGWGAAALAPQLNLLAVRGQASWLSLADPPAAASFLMRASSILRG